MEKKIYLVNVNFLFRNYKRFQGKETFNIYMLYWVNGI